ncbi:MAG: hypothetical protein IAE80_02720 [Anaerolinea sp.]|nr:hypothetical protein [Anaerolinea sp.]
MTEIRHFTDDGSPIKVEVSLTASDKESKGGLQETTRGGKTIPEMVKDLNDAALFEAFRAIYKVARKTELLIGDLNIADPNTPTPLSGAEVQFGIKFDSGLNAVITASLEATITVKLTWGKS